MIKLLPRILLPVALGGLLVTGCSQGSGYQAVGSGLSPGSVSLTDHGMILRDPAGYDWETTRVSLSPDGYVPALVAPASSSTLAAIAPLREVALLDGSGPPEGGFQADVTGFLELPDGTLLAATSDRTTAGLGEVYQRDATGWTPVVATGGRETVLAGLQGDAYAFAGEINGIAATVHVKKKGQDTWDVVPDLLPADCVPSAAATHQGRVWVGAGPRSPAGAACLHRGTWNGFELVPLPGAGDTPNQRQEISALLPVPTGLVVALASYDATTNAALGGQLFLFSDLGTVHALTSLPAGEAPLALAFQDETLYVGTSAGTLHYRNAAGLWTQEPSTPGVDAVTSLLVPDRLTLLIGAQGATGAIVLRRTAKSEKPVPAAPSAGAVDYVNHVKPVLQADCAGCHANLTTGWQLSAGLTDDNADYQVTVEKLDLATPAASGLLASAINVTPHDGGAVWATSDTNYDTVLRWIEGGAVFEAPQTTTPGSTPAPPAAPAPLPPTGTPPVAALDYLHDVKPLLASCSFCHATMPSKYTLTANLDQDADDYLATFTQANLLVPADSPLLTKNNGTVAHVGGELWPTTSSDYMTVLQWIQDGAYYDNPARIPSPPVAPTALLTTVVSQTQIDLAWADNAGDETAYRVERSPAGAATSVAVASLAANATSYSDTSLVANTGYDYLVYALNAGGDSLPSNPASGVTLPLPPVAVNNLLASAVSPIQVDLTWNDNSNNETGFRVERGPAGSGAYAPIVTLPAATTSYSDATDPNTAYDYRVIAMGLGGDALPSNVSTVMTKPLPPKSPLNLAATAASHAQVDLAWTDAANDEITFRVERAPGNSGAYVEIAKLVANSVAYSDRAVVANTAYDYRVIATGAGGDSLPSNVASVTTPPAPVAPVAPSSLVAKAASTSRVDLSWTDNANNETNTLVQRSTAGGAFVVVATLGANASTYADTTVLADTAYDYLVVAIGAGGSSLPSNVAKVMTPKAVVPAPTAPANLVAMAISFSRVDLSWTDTSNNETGFRLERSPSGAAAYATVAMLGANAVTHADTTAAANTSYDYRVVAIGTGGNSLPSNVATVKTPSQPPPAAASGLTATAINSARVDLSWTDNANDESSFRVERGLAGANSYSLVAMVAANTTAYSDVTVQPNTSYDYRVIATGAGGNSLPSNVATVKTPLPPAAAAPSGLLATAISQTQVDLVWNDNSNNELGFRVERSPGGAASYATVVMLPANTISYSDTTVVGNTNYDYRVIATGAGGDSLPSNVASVKTLAAAVTYLTDIKPLMLATKPLGCATASCHVKREKLRLSLNLVDDAADYASFLKNLLLADPANSEILTRPAQIKGHPTKHWNVGDPDYQTIKAWIEGGAPFN